MRRASVSIVSNIAEGCGRQSDRELTRFLRIARGSARELECQLLLSRELGYLSQDIWRELDRDIDEISRMLNGMILSLRTPGEYSRLPTHIIPNTNPRTTYSTSHATIGLKSNMPMGGRIRRIGSISQLVRATTGRIQLR